MRWHLQQSVMQLSRAIFPVDNWTLFRPDTVSGNSRLFPINRFHFGLDSNPVIRRTVPLPSTILDGSRVITLLLLPTQVLVVV